MLRGWQVIHVREALAQRFGGTGSECQQSRIRHASGPEDREHSERVRSEMIGHRYDGEVRELFAAELVTDLDAYGVGNHRICDDLVERLLLFHDAQDGAKLTKILKLRLIEEV